jgi:hypothetical protein
MVYVLDNSDLRYAVRREWDKMDDKVKVVKMGMSCSTRGGRERSVHSFGPKT